VGCRPSTPPCASGVVAGVEHVVCHAGSSRRGAHVRRSRSGREVGAGTRRPARRARLSGPLHLTPPDPSARLPGRPWCT
jgi:hypothetical protein